MELPLRLVAADPLREGRGGVSPTTARPAIAAGADGLAHLFDDSPPEPGFAEFAENVTATLLPVCYQGGRFGTLRFNVSL